MTLDSSKHVFYELKCSGLLNEPEIRFAGIIDETGHLLAGGFKAGLHPLESESKLDAFMEFVAKISLRKEFDKSLGPINYLAARRNNVILISFPFPVSKFVLLVSAEPQMEIEKLAKKVVKIFSDESRSLN